MPRPTHARLVTKTTAGSVLAAAIFAAAGVPAAFAGSEFYTPPASLPAENGALVRSEPMKLGASVKLWWGTTTLPGTAKRIMYRSTDTNGQPVGVTGTYIEPSAKFKGVGSRPLVTYAEGTQGQGDQCAPSYGLENVLSIKDGAVNIGYEVPSIYGLLNRGYAVVVTDYVGLGTTDRVHTYVNRVDQGHAVLDAARAAIRVPGASVTAASPVGAYGYSQGGGAAASAAELAPSYAPELNLKAAYAGAPPADLTAVLKTADGSSLTAVIGFAINGFVQTYPQLGPILDAQTNAAGKAALKKISDGCIGNGLINYAFSKTSKWTTSGKSVSDIVAAEPQIKAIVDAQRIGRIKPQVPVRITTGTKDDIVTHSQVKQLAQDWCGLGATVDYQPIRQLLDSGGTSLNHLTPMLTESDASQAWLGGQLTGSAPPISNCASVPSLP